ncbi:CHAP domain-containing protein [Swingsia samuiensis]|uniref:CHAP domain-containing protein n=1 Tax=Swingsia samuiensis TaxID=1293412 RepID=A0A4Y6UL53_9PROT|nr:CHAP domain-containing protein [Swingsia samuiensis]QDH16765.1 CHAP domain-containing protein [Swingsia samuiensis]
MKKLFVLWACLGLAACGGNRYEYSRASFNGPIQCAPYARAHTGLKLRGDAATWWRQAAGRYARTQIPTPGSVLVFRATSRVPSGHVSIVRRQVGEHTILVDHANWEPGRIDHNVPVTDISAAHNWTMVRVWWAPIHKMGRRPYATYGFISRFGDGSS